MKSGSVNIESLRELFKVKKKELHIWHFITMKIFTIIYCFLYATLTAGAKINIVGFEEGEVTFRCKHKLAWKNDKYFCKDPCKGNEDVLVTVKYGTTAESGRITLVDSGDGAFSVNISQLQLSDSGRYWCAVDRPGFDTFTEVNLTVEKGVASVTPDVSPTWTHVNIFSSVSEMDTSGPAYISTTSNCENREEENFNSITVLYATVGAVSMLSILIFARRFRKCREISKPQPQVCSSSRGLDSADERQVNCEYDNTDKEEQSMKRSPQWTSYALDPPTSASTAADSVASTIYENISFPRGNTDSRQSAADVQNDQNLTSRVYNKPLPPTVSEQTEDASARKQTDKPAESCASNGSDTDSTPCCDSSESKPKTLWFGLDLSGTM